MPKMKIALMLSIAIICLSHTVQGDNPRNAALRSPQQSTTGPIPPSVVSPPVPDNVILDRDDKLMTGVPAYLWRHGCGPTAVGMVIGYYDGHGYSNLIPGDASTQTNAVDQAIASQDNSANPQHYEDYSEPIETSESSPLPDKSEDPPGDEHISNCIADFMETSWSARGNFYGWSWSSDIGPSFTGYVNYIAPQYTPAYYNFWYSDDTWNLLRTEIDHNRPMVFLVDSIGNGFTDHFVTVIGYRDTQGYQEYACMDTWFDSVRWERLRPMSSSYTWGVYGGTTFSLIGSELPSMNLWGLILTLIVIGFMIVRSIHPARYFE